MTKKELDKKIVLLNNTLAEALANAAIMNNPSTVKSIMAKYEIDFAALNDSYNFTLNNAPKMAQRK